MAPKIAIISIGSELLDGRIVDTNSNFLADACYQAGYPPEFLGSCGDDREAIVGMLEYVRSFCDAALICGGLGPTDDDVTRDGVAAFLGESLEFDDRAFEAIREYFASRGREVKAVNRRQAHFPRSASPIENRAGTAPGFWATAPTDGQGGLMVACMPGVPSELKQMFFDSVLPILRRELPIGREVVQQELSYFGVPESSAAETIEGLSLFAAVSVSYRASFPVLRIKLSSSESGAVSDAVQAVCSALPESRLYSRIPGESLDGAVHRLLLERETTLAVAESCTGGRIGSMLTGNPDSSKYFEGGVISYSNAMKQRLLGVPERVLKTGGAVSHEAAAAMAEGVRECTGAEIGVSVTGIAGPGGGSKEKPVGTFYVGLSQGESTHSMKYLYPAERRAVQRYAAHAALDSLRRLLLNQPLDELSSEIQPKSA